jgi:Asp-tRNA(Asn)/Glu-tRNA(Gln) amidotransferase A subunit family amidase
MTTKNYDPRKFKALTYFDAIDGFRDGSDTPRDYLERCIATVSQREPVVQALAFLNEQTARDAADVSTERWSNGCPLSPIDGMPIGIKDLFETKDMPTEMNCAALEGNFPKRDSAVVTALRRAGAVIFGKTVTAELGGPQPGPTTNPYDPARTPGGSSSGSAAAVAAKMMPAAIGTQVGGSIIRPSGFCGVVALKPTQGAINRGERQLTSMSTCGVHAGSIEDMWQVAIEIAKRVGGDPGKQCLSGPPTPPEPIRPGKLIVLETEGWASLDDASKAAFQMILESLQELGIELLSRKNDQHVEAFERSIAKGSKIAGRITAWENQWFYRNLVDENGNGISERAMKVLNMAESMTLDEYHIELREQEFAQMHHAYLAPLADGMITLSCPGPAPLWPGDKQGESLAPKPTGHSVFNYPGSMLFAPAVSMPLMSVGGLPVGVQIIGQQHQDANIVAMARWLLDNVSPVASPPRPSWV